MELKPGSRWRSAVCSTEGVVVRPPKTAATLSCGGHPMVRHGETAPEGLTLSPDAAEPSLIGKRYVDEESGLELLCNKGGAGAIALNGRTLTIRETKKLPSSD